jgi:hypothetical protein
MSQLIPIVRCGWRDAVEEVRAGGKLIRYADGHAELQERERIVTAGHHPNFSQAGVYYFLTRRSVELFDEHMKPLKGESRAEDAGNQ